MREVLSAFIRYLNSCRLGIVAGWDRFFFTPTDPLVLGVIRLCVGMILLYIHLTCFDQAPHLIGPDAWVDQEAITRLGSLPEEMRDKHPLNNRRDPLTGQVIPLSADDEFVINQEYIARTNHGFSIWFIDGIWNNPSMVKITYILGVLSVFLFTIGLFTPVMGVLVWIFHISYVQRGVVFWFGMDAMFAFLLLYLMIGPSGRTCSVDRLWARFRAKRTGQEVEPTQPSWWANLSIRLIQLHMCVVYLIAGLSKLQGETWWNGSAAWLTMNTPIFSDDISGAWLAADPKNRGEWTWHYVSFFFTYATLIFEISFPFVIWNKAIRPWFLTGAIGLHAGIALFMGLGGFGAIMLSGCLAFVSPDGLRWFLQCILGKKAEAGLE